MRRPVWWDDALAFRERAAQPVLARIEEDMAAAPRRVRALLEEIRRRLFDEQLSVAALKRACGIGDNSVSTAFHRAVGVPPRRYVEGCRVEVGAWLLREAQLPVWQAAELVGYASVHTFGRAFRRWAGVGPGGYRTGVEAVVQENCSTSTL